MAAELYDLFVNFSDEAAAHNYIAAKVWPEGPQCPHCGRSGRIGQLRGNSTPVGTYKCYDCRKLFSIRTGTIFEFSNVPLHKWLQAVYLCGCGTERPSAQELSNILNVTYKTSAHMIDRMAQAAARAESTLGRVS